MPCRRRPVRLPLASARGCDLGGGVIGRRRQRARGAPRAASIGAEGHFPAGARKPITRAAREFRIDEGEFRCQRLEDEAVGRIRVGNHFVHEFVFFVVEFIKTAR